MANQCCYCDRRHIDTNMLVLGDNWIEFCEPCGKENTVTNGKTGETVSVSDLFKRLANKQEPEPDPPADYPTRAVSLSNGDQVLLGSINERLAFYASQGDKRCSELVWPFGALLDRILSTKPEGES